MNDGPANSNSSRPATPLLAACAVLTVVLLAAFVGFAWYGHSRHGADGLLAAGIGVGVCWAGAMIALVLTALMRGQGGAVNGMLLGMIFRMGMPLAVGLYFQRQGGAIAEAGVFGMILCCYFITLITETLLSLRIVTPAKNVTEAS